MNEAISAEPKPQACGTFVLASFNSVLQYQHSGSPEADFRTIASHSPPELPLVPTFIHSSILSISLYESLETRLLGWE